MVNELTGIVSFVKGIVGQKLWIASFVLAKQLKIPNLVLSRVTSSMTVNCVRGVRKSFNLGLEMKFEGKQLKVLGYTRKGERGWEFSQEAKDLIVAFMTAFPDFFVGLMRNPNKDKYDDTDFYSAHESVGKMTEILAWIKNSGIKEMEKVDVGSDALHVGDVRKIQEKVDGIYAAYGDAGVRSVNVTNVPRLALLKPEHASYRLGDQSFKVERMNVNVRSVNALYMPVISEALHLVLEELLLESRGNT
jgi:5'-3' exoribonuclease 1